MANWTEERINEELKKIQASIPKNLLKAVFSERMKTPEMKMVLEEALKSDKIDEAKKAKIKNLLDTGEFNKTEIVENKRVAKMIDDHVNRKINEAVKAGRLPPKSAIKNLPFIKKLIK